jgi:hypothetical protein
MEQSDFQTNLLPLTKKFLDFFEKATQPIAPRWPLPVPMQLLLSISHNFTCEVPNVKAQYKNTAGQNNSYPTKKVC